MKNITSTHLEFIKWIAIVSMTLDHFGRILLENNLICLSIGRIAFPLFAFLIAYNYIFNTSNKFNYIKRLFIFALISQPFFMYAFGFNNLNIMFTLSFSLIFIYLFEYFEKNSKNKIEKYIGCIVILFLIGFIGFFVDYIHFGILLVILFYVLLKYENNYILLIIGILIYFMNFKWNAILSTLGLISLLLIFKINIDFRIKVNKYFYYFYYPLHILIFKLITLL